MLLISGVLGCPREPCAPFPKTCRGFFDDDQTNDQWIEKFKTYPLNEQLELYLCTRLFEPPFMGLFDYEIAAHGPAAVPVILKRLESEKDDSARAWLIDLLKTMAREGHLAEEEDALHVITRTIGDMDDEMYKKWSEEDLMRIREALRDSGTQQR